MKKNLNLEELQLFPLASHSDLTRSLNGEEEGEETGESPQQLCPHDHDHHHQQHRPLTIFYDGKACVRHVTDLQARSILMIANKEMEERVLARTPTPSATGSSELPCSSPVIIWPPAPHHQNLNSSPCTGLSMKKSLQSFLQKRKNRVQEASPYNNNVNVNNDHQQN